MNETTGSVFSADGDESILDAGIRQGHILPYSCRDGACGSCRADLVSGQVEYQSDEPEALTDADRASNKVLLCQARARSDVRIRVREAVAAAGMTIKTLPCRVAALRRLAHDVMYVGLRLPRAQSFDYLPGQYIDIILRDGRRRSFSIACANGPDTNIELHVRRVEDGRFSTQVFESMAVGDLLRMEGPLGTFYLDEDSSSKLIFMAGGTGFAPIKAIIESAIERDAFDNKKVFLYWGARAAVDLYLGDLARKWADDHANIEFYPVLSEPTDASWTGRVGFVHRHVVDDLGTQALAEATDLSQFAIYASGPPAMIQAARADFTDVGLAEDAFFYDSFEYSND